jgi:hypothetical protein
MRVLVRGLDSTGWHEFEGGRDPLHRSLGVVARPASDGEKYDLRRGSTLATRRPAAARSMTWRRWRPASGVTLTATIVGTSPQSSPRHTSTARDSSAMCRTPLLTKAVGKHQAISCSLHESLSDRRGAEGGHIFRAWPEARAGQPPFLQGLLRVIVYLTGAVAERERLEKGNDHSFSYAFRRPDDPAMAVDQGREIVPPRLCVEVAHSHRAGVKGRTASVSARNASKALRTISSSLN